MSEIDALERELARCRNVISASVSNQGSIKSLDDMDVRKDGIEDIDDFIENADLQLREIKEQVKHTKSYFIELLEYFGEDMSQDAPELFETLDVFMTAFDGLIKKIKKQNDKSKLKGNNA